jgi:hypothetical protein
MKNENVKRTIPLLICLILVLSTSAFAQDSDIVKLQGRVMSLDLYKNVMTVNERVFVLDPQTTIKDEKEYPMSLDGLKPETWVYVEGENKRALKKLVAKKIYLLPKYIEKRERHLYPFME